MCTHATIRSSPACNITHSARGQYVPCLANRHGRPQSSSLADKKHHMYPRSQDKPHNGMFPSSIPQATARASKPGQTSTHNMAADSQVDTQLPAKSWSSADSTCVVALTRHPRIQPSRGRRRQSGTPPKWQQLLLRVSSKLQECCWPPQAGGQRFKPNSNATSTGYSTPAGL